MSKREGYWIKVSECNFECSCCHSFFNNAYLSKVCPSCKAIMSEEVEELEWKEGD